MTITGDAWEEQTRKLTQLVESGLSIDGSHHKQWFLEQIYKELLSAKELKKLKELCWIEDGVAP